MGSRPCGRSSAASAARSQARSLSLELIGGIERPLMRVVHMKLPKVAGNAWSPAMSQAGGKRILPDATSPSGALTGRCDGRGSSLYEEGKSVVGTWAIRVGVADGVGSSGCVGVVAGSGNIIHSTRPGMASSLLPAAGTLRLQQSGGMERIPKWCRRLCVRQVIRYGTLIRWIITRRPPYERRSIQYTGRDGRDQTAG